MKYTITGIYLKYFKTLTQKNAHTLFNCAIFSTLCHIWHGLNCKYEPQKATKQAF